MRTETLLILFFPLAFLTGCSGDSTEPGSKPKSVTQTVGASGAVLELDGATVTFPANAVARDTEVTIEATDESPPSGFESLSPIFACSPSGLTFDPKVVMEMEFVDDGKGATMLWSSGDDPAFVDVGGTIDGNVMRAQVAHFSRGFVGYQPR
jgi:hypothetical protein